MSLKQEIEVIPIGEIVGIKLYTSGVLVVGMAEVQGMDNEKYKPYENSGIKEGDMIVSIEEKEISNTVELVNTVNKSVTLFFLKIISSESFTPGSIFPGSGRAA